jgi:hypothetical protein
VDSILIRTTRGPDDAVLEGLGILDEAHPLLARALGAEVDGACRAAISLIDGRAIANPFCRTADVVALLRTTAERRLPALAPERE